ncbi:MAG: hypothetical protein PHF63_00515 [Herbinix sp.]|nr:hypothetical protein [Herbinix sp.]
MSIEIVNDDIFNFKKGVICQQVNCKGKMGAGLAKDIAQKWPFVKESYLKLFDNNPNGVGLMGTVQFVPVKHDLIIANIFGQFDYGRTPFKTYTDYKAFDTAMKKVWKFAVESKLSVAVPYKIGCNLGGGDWKEIEKILCNTFVYNRAVRLYIYHKERWDD